MKTVIDYFERSVQLYPKEIFLQEVGQEITYEDFWKLVLKKAGYLQGKVHPFQPVALMMDKSIELVSWMMAVAYEGACYCVLDNRQSVDRLNKMLDSLQPSLILVSKEYASVLSEKETIVVSDLCLEEGVNPGPSHRLSTAPLYINFTSGSTGIPKGVAVSDRSVMDFIPTFCQEFNFTQQDVFANQAPLDFDVSVKDLYSAAYLGAKVVLIPRDYFSKPTELMDLLVRKNVTTLVWAVSALCFVSIMNGLKYKVPSTIRQILFSGEVMPSKHLRKWMEALPEARFVNLYGPTEITCNCTFDVVNPTSDLDQLSLGRAFSNEWVFLLDEEDKEITQPYQEGEICVSGDCLALGYWNQEEKTATAFPRNPLVLQVPILMYRTGDLAWYDEQGKLYFRGRKDFQIKYLGHRIELGEIEACMHNHPSCERACVIFDEKRNRLRAFFEGQLEKEELMVYLKEKLPSYMIPSHVEKLDHLPLSKNGKINRNALKGESV